MTTARAFLGYAAATVGLIALARAGLGLVWHDDGGSRALLIAAAIAVPVQVAAFALARRMAPARALHGWAIGSGLSMLTLIVFGFVAQGMQLPLEPALFGLATYLFLTELAEPFFLRT